MRTHVLAQPMILLIDNYDSFTHNLRQQVIRLAPGIEVLVRRNDQVTAGEARRLGPRAIIISPGPGTPAGAGNSVDIIRVCADAVPILGVCLGHQCIAEAFGGATGPARVLRHGKVSPVLHDGRGLFEDIASPMTAARYHSLAIREQSLPACLEIRARTPDGEIMAVAHRSQPVFGVQFHPESFLTPDGDRMMGNFLSRRSRNQI